MQNKGKIPRNPLTSNEPNHPHGLRIQDLFTFQEEKRLLQALSRSSPEGTFTENEYVELMNWAVRVRYANNILAALMTGTLKPVFKNNDIHFEPTNAASS